MPDHDCRPRFFRAFTSPLLLQLLSLDITLTMTRSATAPGAFRRDARPPISSDPAPTPGAVAVSRRRTVVPRPTLHPVSAPTTPADEAGPGRHRRTVPITDAYVRRFWTAAIGPGAVADLLRLAAAAERGRSLLRPVHLDTLLRHRLVVCVRSTIVVPRTVPPVPRSLLTMLPVSLRRDHEEWQTGAPPVS